MNDVLIDCPDCANAMPVETFLDHVTAYRLVTDSGKFTCPHCAATIDVRVRPGLISLGYVYAAGAPHFAGMIDVDVAGLDRTRGGPATYRGRSWMLDG